jgi:hypothetical protein
MEFRQCDGGGVPEERLQYGLMFYKRFSFGLSAPTWALLS